MVFTSFLTFAAGIVLLVGGAHFLTNYASSLAKRWGISQYAIGITFVAFFTSLPEISVAFISGLTSFLDPSTLAVEIASGTVIGSNITNLALVLGVAALIHPLGVTRDYLREENFLIILTVLVSILLLLGMDFRAGILVFAVMLTYIIYLLRKRPRGPIVVAEEVYYRFLTKESFTGLFFAVLGAAGLLVGSMITVDSVLSISEGMGVPKFLIALIAVSLGTSLPEVTASVMAAAKRMKGLSIGNVLGSNIFNVAGLAAASMFSSIPANAKLLFFNIPIFLAVALIAFLFSKRQSQITRKEGAVLLFIYALFISLQFL